MISIFMTIVLSFIGGVFYRMGGSGYYARFWRELGQGICFVLEMFLLGFVLLTWQSLLGIFLGCGVCWAESTYFKKSGTDAGWWNWGLVGMVFGCIALPFCILTGKYWIGFTVRLPLCIGFTVLWQLILSQMIATHLSALLKIFGKPPIEKDITDEVGRGFINIVTLPFLLLGG